MVGMNWKDKLLDELISRSTFLVVLFLVPLWFVKLTPENERAYIAIAGLSLATGVAKTVANGIKAKAAGGVSNGQEGQG